jgi:phosphoribosylaminoimidazole-succinocarboxamide synthase
LCKFAIIKGIIYDLKSMEYKQFIAENLDYSFVESELNLDGKKVGKVRDSYDRDGHKIIVTTDRQSAFDRVLASIPFKGQVLNQVSLFWFDLTQKIIPNHIISSPDPNVIIAQKLDIFPVEFVVRAYLSGSTSTSAWTNYNNGMRNFCGNTLLDGMKKNQAFVAPILTPTTKSATHDELISPDQIVSKGLMTQGDWDYCSGKAIELFNFAAKKALEKGLILVDTKLEFGKDANGEIVLADEIFTPDSSRYWISSSYSQRFEGGLEPENIDKEFLRLWFSKNCDPYNDEFIPSAPDELVIELSSRYIQLFEMITGQLFQFPDTNKDINQRIKKNLGI